MKHQIDQLTAADHPRLLEVWEASVRATHDFVPEEKISHLKGLIITQQLFQKSEMYCVRDKSGIVGGFAGVTGDSLDMLFLHPSMIGTGAGKTLVQYAIKERGVTKVDVNEQNRHAKAFYEHFGFKVISRSETDDNGEPFPLLHMQRKMHVTIRQATIGDLETLLDISNRTYHESFFEAYNDPAAFTAYTSEIFAPELIKAELVDTDIEFYFIFDGDLPAGYSKLNFGNKQHYVQDKNSAEIDSIYVLAAYQSKRFGETLLNHSIGSARSRSLKTLWLAVWENNSRAINFYERHGFRKFDNHRYMLGENPQTDVLMTINIY